MRNLEVEKLYEIIEVIENTVKDPEEIKILTNCIQNQIEQIVCFNHLIEKLTDPEYLPTYIEAEYILNKSQYEEWFNFINQESSMIYELLNQDYINGLANYISTEHKTEKKFRILEAGAGNGRLTHFLRNRLNELNPNQFELIPTDSGSWEITQNYHVETISINDALQKYNPDMVICSWMPYRKDFTQAIRDCGSVIEYILIGETDHGCCGDTWLTWGIQNYEDEIKDKKLKPYINDGFKRKDLIKLEKFQICRTDTPNNAYNSKTVSFKRK